MFCEKCGKPMEEGCAFCTFCGAGYASGPTDIRKPVRDIRPMRYFFMTLVVQYISEGKLFTRVCAFAMRALGVLVAVGGFYVWVKMWRTVGSLQGAGVIGGIIFQIFLLVAIYMLTHLLFIRASTIRRLPVSEYTVIPIVSIFFRLFGEWCLCGSCVLGAGIFVLILFAGTEGTFSMPGLVYAVPFTNMVLSATESSVIAAFIMLALMTLWGFLGLLFWYLLAEISVVAIDIAQNVRGVREAAERSNEPSKRTS